MESTLSRKLALAALLPCQQPGTEYQPEWQLPR